MSGADDPNRKHVLAERLEHLEAELNGALEAVAEESMPMGEMLAAPNGDGLTKTIRGFQEEIERLRQEYEDLG